MIQKVVKIKDLKDNNSAKEDLTFWLSKTPEERIFAVEYLRRQYHGISGRLQRVVKIIQQS
jgi:hypothetical protein